MKKLVFGFLIISVLVLSLNRSIQAQGKVTRSGEFTAPKTVNQCTSNDCKPTGCASCIDLTVYLPLGAQVDSIHCLTNAGYPNDFQHHDLHEVACGQDVSWSIFDTPVQSTTPNNTVVSTKYHNRSHNRDRDVELVVNWH